MKDYIVFHPCVNYFSTNMKDAKRFIKKFGNASNKIMKEIVEAIALLVEYN